MWGDCGVREAESSTSAWDYEAHFEAPYDAEPAEDLSRVREVVRASLEETLTLEANARRAGRSARSLQRSLTQAGTTFRAETSRLRMERAREMLEQSELKIESIARAVGLRSASSFASTFRAVTGTTSSEYRRTRERSGARHSTHTE